MVLVLVDHNEFSQFLKLNRLPGMNWKNIETVEKELN